MSDKMPKCVLHRCRWCNAEIPDASRRAPVVLTEEEAAAFKTLFLAAKSAHPVSISDKGTLNTIASVSKRLGVEG